MLTPFHAACSFSAPTRRFHLRGDRLPLPRRRVRYGSFDRLEDRALLSAVAGLESLVTPTIGSAASQDDSDTASLPLAAVPAFAPVPATVATSALAPAVSVPAVQNATPAATALTSLPPVAAMATTIGTAVTSALGSLSPPATVPGPATPAGPAAQDAVFGDRGLTDRLLDGGRAALPAGGLAGATDGGDSVANVIREATERSVSGVETAAGTQATPDPTGGFAPQAGSPSRHGVVTPAGRREGAATGASGAARQDQAAVAFVTAVRERAAFASSIPPFAPLPPVAAAGFFSFAPNVARGADFGDAPLPLPVPAVGRQAALPAPGPSGEEVPGDAGPGAAADVVGGAGVEPDLLGAETGVTASRLTELLVAVAAVWLGREVNRRGRKGEGDERPVVPRSRRRGWRWQAV